jgi:hypothetical protein
MYSNADLDDAVDAGVLTSDTLLAFRSFIAERHKTSLVDEEQFRLLTGFNDIFVAIAGVILLVAVGSLGTLIGTSTGMVRDHAHMESPLAGILVAGTAWTLGEYFTRQRRMALPSIIFLLAFSIGMFWSLTASGLMIAGQDHDDQMAVGITIGISGILTALATYLHWRRFAVPITIAALVAALVGAVIGFVGANNAIDDLLYWPMLICGIGVFAFAMRWDMSDRDRRTRRSDVAFWLHMLAAPLIAHALFHLLHAFDHDLSTGTGLLVVLLYMLFGLVALAVDRRALLVSSLAYVLWALQSLFEQAGALQFGMALTALVIGSALLLLSALWHKARAPVVGWLPGDLAMRLPPASDPGPASRAAAA